MADVKLRGFTELDRELAKLPLKIQKKIVAKMTREGAKIVQKAAKQLVPVDTGTLKRAITTRKKPQRELQNKDLTAHSALVRTKGTTRSKAAPHAHLVEFGHAQVVGGKLNKGGRQVGFVAPRPFMRPAFDKNKGRIIARMKAILLDGIGKYRRG